MLGVVLAQREGFQGPSTEEFVWPCLTPDLFGVGGLCINRVVLLLFLAALVTLLFFVAVFRRLKLVPGKAQSVGELGIEFVRDNVILQMMGPAGLRYLPYLTTVFFFIFIANSFSIIPGINYPPTSSTAIPGFLAVLTWLIFNYAGIRKNGGWNYVRHTLFPAGVPWPLYILIAPIEFVSVFLIRPLTLTVRLAANMIAGHLTLVIFLLGTEYLIEPLLHGEWSITNLWAVGAFGLAVALSAFELLVAALQAFIFVILTATYIEGALSVEEH